MSMRVGYPVFYKRLITSNLVFEYLTDPISKFSHDLLQFLIAHHEAGPLHLILSKFCREVMHLFLFLKAVYDLEVRGFDQLLIDLRFIDFFVLIERFFVHVLSHIVVIFLESVGFRTETGRFEFLSLRSLTWRRRLVVGPVILSGLCYYLHLTF